MSAPALPQRYSIVSLLGEGGQGRVYRVRDSLRDRDLALKLVSASDAEFLRREFDTLRQIRHENLIQVFDWGSLDSGDAYYTMELIEGQDWGRRMGAPQLADDVRHILTGVLRGLAHLHCHGEIHGDLKPGNILLGPGGVVKVTDIGMGGGVDGRDGGGGIAGTPGYTAPECWEGRPADIRADLYSVGVMAYEALTGKHPFGGRTIREVVAGQMEGWVPSPAAHRVRVPADLERVVMRALERESQLRQGSADEFMEGFGVEDRVGVILGGRVVGRDVAIASVLAKILSDDPHDPTLIRVVGPPGSGKRMLLREVSHQLSKQAVAATTWAEWSSSRGPRFEPVAGRRLAIFVEGTPSQTEDLEALVLRKARDNWARAIEHASPSALVFLIASSEARTARDGCELDVLVDPLTIEQMDPFIQGLIGDMALPGPLIARIHALTGGLPESVSTAVRALIARGMLSRRDSRWQFNETTEIRSLSIPEVASPWRARWRQMGSNDRQILLAMALINGWATPSLLHSIGAKTATMQRLEAQGYVVGRNGAWTLASEAMQHGIAEAAEPQQLEAVAQKLLASRPGLESEQRADVLLRVHSPEALVLAPSAAEAASQRGASHLAIRRYRGCRMLAEELGDQRIASECAMKEAAVLNEIGRFSDAVALLEVEPDKLPESSNEHAVRYHLLGVAKRGIGDLVAAADYFERAQLIRGESGTRDLALESLCELAEIRWRFGNLEDRNAIVKTLQGELARPDIASVTPDMQAALSYHLAAALLEIGQLSEAFAALDAASKIECSAYWKMRLRIAQGTAEHRRGRPDQTLRRLDEAWSDCEACGADAYRPRIMTNRGAALYQLGRFRESMVANTLGLEWSRRVGNQTELLFAATGTAGCAIILGEYQAALRDIDEAMKLAEVYGDPVSVEKVIELNAWAQLWLGNAIECENISRRAIDRFANWTTTETRPRLYWVLSRARMMRGDLIEAETWLGKALELVRKSGDPEDLPGIEIEVLRLEGKAGDHIDRSTVVRRIRAFAEASPIPTIVTLGAMAIGEILLDAPDGFETQREFLSSALASADSSEIAEASWRINYYLAALHRAAGDERMSRTRFSAALKGLRQIADRLDGPARSRYLEAPHVRPLLQSMSGAP